MIHYKEFLWLAILVAVLAFVVSAQDAQARPDLQPAQASYYTLFGNRTSCGKTAGPTAFFVASLKPDTANCGLKVTICHRRHCVNVRVQDRGAWRSDSRRFDLQPRVKRALGCPDLCNIGWKRGWTYR